MTEYRTPEEWQLTDEQDARIKRVLDQAVHDGASCKAAMVLGEPADVVNRWVDALWDRLRDSLPGRRPGQEDQLRAIIVLLEDRMTAEAGAILGAIPRDFS